MFYSFPLVCLSGSDVSEDENEYESYTSSTPNTSALETLVRTACESLAVSTLLAGTSSASVDPLNTPGQETSKESPALQADGHSGSGITSSSTGSTPYPSVPPSNLDQVSSPDDTVFSVIFGHGRGQNVAEGSSNEERGSLPSSKELQETALDLTEDNLSDIGDVEVHRTSFACCILNL